MATSINHVTSEMKEATTITVMWCMLLTYSRQKHILFEQALFNFADSRTHGDLFDFSTDIWKEDPDYLHDIYEEEMGL